MLVLLDSAVYLEETTSSEYTVRSLEYTTPWMIHVVAFRATSGAIHERVYTIALPVVATMVVLYYSWSGLHPHGPILDPEVGIHPPAIW